MKVKIGQIWKLPRGYAVKVANYDDTSGKWIVKVCGQDYYFYASTQRILTWELQKRLDKTFKPCYNKDTIKERN